MNGNSIIKGSLADIAKRDQVSIAETFLNADAVIIVDVSGSMDIKDSRGFNRRYDIALEELSNLQETMPGKLAIIAFSNYPMFVPTGAPPFLAGMTDLAAALRFAKVADVPGIRFIVISDGEPDDEQEALTVARTFTNRIDVVYVGPGENSHARRFLTSLAEASGGVSVTCDRVKELSEGVIGLLADKV